jgi:hypothetical protein
MNCVVRFARDDDAEQASAVIERALRETNARDYSAENIKRIVGNFTPSAVRALIANHTAFFVAVVGERIAGTASLNGSCVQTVMVSHDLQGRGVGPLMMRGIEGARGAGAFSNCRSNHRSPPRHFTGNSDTSPFETIITETSGRLLWSGRCIEEKRRVQRPLKRPHPLIAF